MTAFRYPSTPRTIILIIGTLAACSDGGNGPGDSAPVFDVPVVIPAPVSTPGWEDSGMISPDGTRLYFTYLRIDPIVFLTEQRIRLSGPLRPGWPTTPPYDTLGAELYQSDLINGVWSEPANLGPVINLPEELEGDEWVSADGQRILFTNGIETGPRGEDGIWYAGQHGGVWQTAVLASSVGFPFGLGNENPHLTLDEATLSTSTTRAAGRGSRGAGA